MSDFSRRTLVRGVAWSVPVVAVAANAPAFAGSDMTPPPPMINLGGACGNTGATQKGCGGKFTLQVPLTVNNPTSKDIVFQITAMYTSNDSTTPVGPGNGVTSGVRGIFKTPAGFATADQDNCTPATKSSCPGGVQNGSVVVAAGTTGTFYIESNPTGSADDFSTRIEYRLLDATTCAPLSGPFVAKTEKAISPQNCNG